MRAMLKTLIRLPHPVQGKRKAHHDEAGQAQHVHAEENVFGEHWRDLRH
jgi:hypothetical protein